METKHVAAGADVPLTRDCLVICTRHRPLEMFECLKSVALLRQQPHTVLIVDSSSDARTSEVAFQFSELNRHVNLVYKKTEAGLTLQRNHALQWLGDSVEIVHFIDDDVVLEPTYTLELNAALRAADDIAGAGAMVLGSQPHRPSLYARITMRDSLTPGKVLKSGYNVGAHMAPQGRDVDWLPGCAMSFRVSAISGLRFDENRVGYAMGEDVDFGLKAGARGRLVHVPSARLLHKLSPTNRHDRPLMMEMSLRHRWQLAKDFPIQVSKSFVVYASIATALPWLVRGVPKAVLQRDNLLLELFKTELGTLIKLLREDLQCT